MFSTSEFEEKIDSANWISENHKGSKLEVFKMKNGKVINETAHIITFLSKRMMSCFQSDTWLRWARKRKSDKVQNRMSRKKQVPQANGKSWKNLRETKRLSRQKGRVNTDRQLYRRCRVKRGGRTGVKIRRRRVVANDECDRTCGNGSSPGYKN